MKLWSKILPWLYIPAIVAIAWQGLDTHRPPRAAPAFATQKEKQSGPVSFTESIDMAPPPFRQSPAAAEFANPRTRRRRRRISHRSVRAS